MAVSGDISGVRTGMGGPTGLLRVRPERPPHRLQCWGASPPPPPPPRRTELTRRRLCSCVGGRDVVSVPCRRRVNALSDLRDLGDYFTLKETIYFVRECKIACNFKVKHEIL